jgi:UDP-glucose 4-epimerase
MKAIVSGADGFVGSNLVKELLRHGYRVFALDLPETPRRLESNDMLTYISLPIEKLGDLSKVVPDVVGSDVFFHFAWRGSAGPERNDETIQLANAINTAKCLRIASSLGVRKFVCAGSIMEYETNDVTYLQGSVPAMPYIYGAGKTAAHEICKPIANSLGVSLIWAYITNAFGVGESSPRFINSTIRKIIRKEKLEFTSGVQNYDFVYVDDVATAFRLLGEKGKGNKGYVIGSGHAQPLKKFILEMVAELKPAQGISFGSIPYTGINTPIDTFSIEDLVDDCGFVPSVSFPRGIRLTYEYLKGLEDAKDGSH